MKLQYRSSQNHYSQVYSNFNIKSTKKLHQHNQLLYFCKISKTLEWIIIIIIRYLYYPSGKDKRISHNTYAFKELSRILGNKFLINPHTDNMPTANSNKKPSLCARYQSKSTKSKLSNFKALGIHSYCKRPAYYCETMRTNVRLNYTYCFYPAIPA